MRRALCAWATALAAIGAGAPAPRDTLEYEVKAAMLYNFAKFVEWPGEGREPLVIGVLGKDPFGPVLDEVVRDKTVHGRPLVVRRFHQLAELGACHILFIARSESRLIPEVLEPLHKAGVLTVADIDQFAKSGGVIGFTMDNGRIRFEINLGAARRAGLRISSRLLGLALVTGGAPAGEVN